MSPLKVFLTLSALSALGFAAEARSLRALSQPAIANPTVALCTGPRDQINRSQDCAAYRVRLSKLELACVSADSTAKASALCNSNGIATYQHASGSCSARATYLICARNAARIVRTD